MALATFSAEQGCLISLSHKVRGVPFAIALKILSCGLLFALGLFPLIKVIRRTTRFSSVTAKTPFSASSFWIPYSPSGFGISVDRYGEENHIRRNVQVSSTQMGSDLGKSNRPVYINSSCKFRILRDRVRG